MLTLMSFHPMGHEAAVSAPGARALTRLAVLLLAVAAAACATAARSEDLLDVYRAAQRSDAVFEAARFQAQAALEKIPQARAGLLPALGLNLNTGRQSGEASFSEAPYTDRQVRSSGASLQLSQPLYRRAAWIALDQAHAQVRQAMAVYEQAQQELILRVCQRYFDVLVARDSVAVSDFQIRAVGQQLELARRNFEVGLSTVTDVHESQARFDLASAQRIAALNDLEMRRVELERLLGAPAGELAAWRDGAQLAAADADTRAMPLESWVEKARNAYPVVRAQEAAHEIAEREVARNQAGHLPTLDLTASYGKTFTSGSLSSPADIAVRNRQGQLGLQLSVPLLAGGGVSARVREAAALLGKAGADLDDARRQAAALARQAYAGVANGQAQSEALASAVRSSKSAVDAKKIGYQTGTRINIDVLNAEQQLYASQRDLARNRVETLMNRLRLKAAAGTLDESEVHALNALLEPAFPAPKAMPARPAPDH